jgi:drug/metabolite transporter (DMT)-like permease
MACGSSVFTVVYSSITIYTALLSKIFFGRNMHPLQWLGIAITISGLAIVTKAEEESEAPAVLYGVFLVFVGTLAHSCIYVLTEYALVFADDPVPPERLATILGTIMGKLSAQDKGIFK